MRRWIAFIALAGIVLLTAAACSDNNSGGTETATATVEEQAATSTTRPPEPTDTPVPPAPTQPQVAVEEKPAMTCEYLTERRAFFTRAAENGEGILTGSEIDSLFALVRRLEEPTRLACDSTVGRDEACLSIAGHYEEALLDDAVPNEIQGTYYVSYTVTLKRAAELLSCKLIGD